MILFALGNFKTSIISGCNGTALVTARPAAAMIPDQKDALATSFFDGYRQLRMNPVITRRQAEQHNPIVKVKLSTEPGRHAVMLIVGIGGSKFFIMCENRVKATVDIPKIAAIKGTPAAGAPPFVSADLVMGEIVSSGEILGSSLFPFKSGFDVICSRSTSCECLHRTI